MSLSPLTGDVGFSRDAADLASRVIRWAEARKYGKPTGWQSPSFWNHAFLVTDDQGGIVQACGGGVVRGQLGQYHAQEYVLYRPAYFPEGAQEAAKAMNEMLGQKYGWLTIVCEALAFLTGTRLRFGIEGTSICSGAVAEALTRAMMDMGPECDWNSPADDYAVALEQHWTLVDHHEPGSAAGHPEGRGTAMGMTAGSPGRPDSTPS